MQTLIKKLMHADALPAVWANQWLDEWKIYVSPWSSQSPDFNPPSSSSSSLQGQLSKKILDTKMLLSFGGRPAPYDDWILINL